MRRIPYKSDQHLMSVLRHPSHLTGVSNASEKIKDALQRRSKANCSVITRLLLRFAVVEHDRDA